MAWYWKIKTVNNVSESKIYIVHCIDAEGPLHETIQATFERLEHTFHLKFDPSKGLLTRLQAGKEKLGGLEKVGVNAVPCHNSFLVPVTTFLGGS